MRSRASSSSTHRQRNSKELESELQERRNSIAAWAVMSKTSAKRREASQGNEALDDPGAGGGKWPFPKRPFPNSKAEGPTERLRSRTTHRQRKSKELNDEMKVRSDSIVVWAGLTEAGARRRQHSRDQEAQDDLGGGAWPLPGGKAKGAKHSSPRLALRRVASTHSSSELLRTSSREPSRKSSTCACTSLGGQSSQESSLGRQSSQGSVRHTSRELSLGRQSSKESSPVRHASREFSFGRRSFQESSLVRHASQEESSRGRSAILGVDAHLSSCRSEHSLSEPSEEVSAPTGGKQQPKPGQQKTERFSCVKGGGWASDLEAMVGQSGGVAFSRRSSRRSSCRSAVVDPSTRQESATPEQVSEADPACLPTMQNGWAPPRLAAAADPQPSSAERSSAQRSGSTSTRPTSPPTGSKPERTGASGRASALVDGPRSSSPCACPDASSSSTGEPGSLVEQSSTMWSNTEFGKSIIAGRIERLREREEALSKQKKTCADEEFTYGALEAFSDGHLLSYSLNEAGRWVGLQSERSQADATRSQLSTSNLRNGGSPVRKDGPANKASQLRDGAGLVTRGRYTPHEYREALAMGIIGLEWADGAK